MGQAKANDRVKVHYTGSLKDGTVFDSSVKREPLEFTIGQSMVIPGFENGIIGMKVGEKKTIAILPDQAYGEHRDDLVGIVDRTRLPENVQPEIGMVLQARSPEGEMINVTVTAVTEDGVALDMNHPLAGKELVFEVDLIEVVPA
jgi:peptidylprolyl isomerase